MGDPGYFLHLLMRLHKEDNSVYAFSVLISAAEHFWVGREAILLSGYDQLVIERAGHLLACITPSVRDVRPKDLVTLTVKEKINAALNRNGELSYFDIQGILSLQILNPVDGFIQVQIESGSNPGILFETHPNINKVFSPVPVYRDTNRPFPTCQGRDGDGVGLMRWRMRTNDELMVPVTVNCRPNEACVSFKYDSKNSIFVWSVPLIDNSNRKSMEFVVPPANASAFFPISVLFYATARFLTSYSRILP
ncbi:hypothetical protein MLD38_016476 [Melastoma candidum]|uniref:Uncharacterized protein n=1 Tax=Melastoma candidum TaxID=119954 RepID=A0ACB9QVQ6_9MYRT|nr:hypothetical protein MLD38_016476 [Melastoma candidum]